MLGLSCYCSALSAPGPNVSRVLREVACAESSFLNATKTRFGVKGQLFRWEEFHPNLGKPPGSPMWVRRSDPGWGVISFTFWGSRELMFQKPRQFWSSPSPKDLHGNFRADTPKKTTRCRELWSLNNLGMEENKNTMTEQTQEENVKWITRQSFHDPGVKSKTSFKTLGTFQCPQLLAKFFTLGARPCYD